MARKAMILKQQAGTKFSTRRYNRCKICGRPHAYLRDYGVCRICFRELAYKGEIPGVKNVAVILNSGATSKVTVLTDTPLDDAALGDAVPEAGSTLTGISRDF